MSRLKLKKKKSKFGTILLNHINHYKREYFIITILFFIGLILGVLFINYANETQIQEIDTYLNELLSNMKQSENIALWDLFKESTLSNFIIIALLWFGASTIIGIPIVYGTIAIKGFSIGYTISSLIASFGMGKGILMALSLLLLHNLIFIPAMFATCVSGVKLYQSIMKNKNRENIKLEILRHTIFCALMLILMLISSVVEVYLSTNITILMLKYINI